MPEQFGAILVENANFSGLAEHKSLDSLTKDITLFTPFKTSLVSYLNSLTVKPNRIHNFQDPIDFTKACLEDRRSSILISAWMNSRLPKRRTPLTLLTWTQLRRMPSVGARVGIFGALETYNLDALVAPSISRISTHFAVTKGYPMASASVGYHSGGTEIKRTRWENLIDITPGVP